MKEHKLMDVKRPMLVKVTCDDCGKECTNTYADILVQFSFCEKADLQKTICYECWENKYKEKEKS